MDESELPESEKKKSKIERYAEMGWDPLKALDSLEIVVNETQNPKDSDEELKTESPNPQKNKIEFPVYAYKSSNVTY